MLLQLIQACEVFSNYGAKKRTVYLVTFVIPSDLNNTVYSELAPDLGIEFYLYILTKHMSYGRQNFHA